ncbi:MAG: oligosaccharide flippase family protein [Acetobacteraceae bacterium]|nr:oligosaccharide flippase family protein [Acetobacteraceae bacterium]
MRLAGAGVFRVVAAILRRGGNVASMAKVLALRSLALGVNVLTGLLTAAALGPAGRGELTALGVAPAFLAGIASFGLHGSLIYNVKADPEHEPEYVGAALIMTGAAGLVFALAGAVVEPYWLAQYGQHTIALARVLLLATPIACMTWALVATAEARGWFGFANAMLYFQSSCTLVILIPLIGLGLLTPFKAALAYSGPCLPVFTCLIWRAVREVRPVLAVRAPFPKRLLSYGLRLYGVDILGTLSSYLDQVVVIAILVPGLVGIYSVALSSARVLAVLQGAITSVLFPSIAARSTAEIVERVSATLRMASLVTGVSALALGVVAPYAIVLLYGARFADATGPFRLLLLDVAIVSSARILYLAYSGSGRPEWVSAFETVGVAVSVSFMLVLVPHFNVIGAAVSVLSGSLARLVCGVAGLPVILNVEIPRLLLSWSDVKAGARALRLRVPAAAADTAP